MAKVKFSMDTEIRTCSLYSSQGDNQYRANQRAVFLLLTGNARISLSDFGLVTCGSRANLGLWVL